MLLVGTLPLCPRPPTVAEVDAADVDGSTSASGLASSSSTDGTAREPEPERLASVAGTAARKSSWAVQAARFASRSASSGESCARDGW